MRFSVLVGRLDGTTLCVRADGPAMPVSRLMAAIHDAEGVPPSLQRLVAGGRDLKPGDELCGPAPPAVALCLRVAGGKGGFGAMLRGKGLAAGQRKTSNFDACRDLNGVRLKAVNQERQITEWRAQQQAKHDDKGGKARARAEAAPPAPDKGAPAASFDLDGYYEANERARAAAAAAVSAGLAAKRRHEELDEALVEAAAEGGGGASGEARAHKAPRAAAPAAAPGGHGVGARWSALGDLPSDDGSSSSDGDGDAS